MNSHAIMFPYVTKENINEDGFNRQHCFEVHENRALSMVIKPALIRFLFFL